MRRFPVTSKSKNARLNFIPPKKYKIYPLTVYYRNSMQISKRYILSDAVVSIWH